MGPRLKVDLEADTSKLDRSLGQVDAKVRKAVNQKSSVPSGAVAGAAEGGINVAAGVGLALVAASAVMVKSTMDYADRLADLSDQTNLAIDDIDALGKSATAAGKDTEAALKMINEMQDSRVKALQGDDAKMAAFQKLGISKEQLANTDNITKLLAGVNAQGSGNRAALSDIVGKKSVGLFTAMKEDLADWENFKTKLKEQGRLIDPEQVRTVEEFNDTLRELKESLMTTLLPAITTFLRAFLDSFYWLRDEIRVALTGLMAALDVMPSFWEMFRKLLIWPLTHPKEFLQGGFIAAGFGIITDEMKEAFDNAIAETQAQIDEERAAREAKRKTANEGKEVVGQVQKIEPKVEEQKDDPQHARPLPSDSMVAVGNFLGANVSSLESIGKQQTELLRQQVSLQRQTIDTIRQFWNRDFTLG